MKGEIPDELTEITSNVSRRKLLRGVGAGAVTGVSGLGAVQTTAAREDGVRELMGWEKWTAIRAVKTTSEYKTLRRYFKQTFDRVTTPDDARVFETTGADGTSYRVVSFTPSYRGPPARAPDENTTTNIAISVTECGSIRDVRATRTVRGDDDSPEAVTVFALENGRVVANEYSIEVDLGQTTGSVVETAAVSKCSACRTIFDLACVVGCGVGTGAICLMAAVTIVGGLACAAVAAAVCYFIGRFGCSPGARAACKRIKVNGNAMCP